MALSDVQAIGLEVQSEAKEHDLQVPQHPGGLSLSLFRPCSANALCLSLPVAVSLSLAAAVAARSGRRDELLNLQLSPIEICL